MVIVTTIYIILVWLIFGRFKLLPWNGTWKTIVVSIGLVIILTVIGLLNFYTPSGSISLIGRVTEIRPGISGRVTSIPIKPNEKISKGDTLLEIEREPFAYEVSRLEAALAESEANERTLRSNVEIAQSNLDAAEAERKLAVYKLEDVQRLVDRKVSPKNDLLRTKLELEIAESKVISARQSLSQAKIAATTELNGEYTGTIQIRAQLNRAKWNLQQTRIVAPSDGVVTGLSLSEGSQLSPLTSAMAFIDSTDIRLIARFSQNAARSAKVGAEIWLIFSSQPGKIYKSKIVQLVPGTAQGQLTVSGLLPDLAMIGRGNTMGAIVEIPPQLPPQVLVPGNSGSATVFAEDAGPIGTLAVVLTYLRSLTAYL